ncbi:hypothetical protein [Cellulomonas marina]|uniref:Uncharacterized protein n=1 Tax=Cellulomonas marina TaxID=988821 RepID=A0A1I0ZR20_9CELL|nr:hypothetical protein [Cellulomonas marina]GIG28821.1 hypothetical protein Cma02nite_14210 [Cellulomonas marina]SFB28095.1 hypothetical protein SAMN05421867_11274 [Cellulomonas marina]
MSAVERGLRDDDVRTPEDDVDALIEQLLHHADTHRADMHHADAHRGRHLVPWHVLPEHRLSTDLALLHLEAARRDGATLPPEDVRRLATWRHRLEVADLVLDYDPSTEDGFRYVPRRHGVDVDLVRAPGHRRHDADPALDRVVEDLVDETIARVLAPSAPADPLGV